MVKGAVRLPKILVLTCVRAEAPSPAREYIVLVPLRTLLYGEEGTKRVLKGVLKGALNGYSEYARLATGFANVRAGTPVLKGHSYFCCYKNRFGGRRVSGPLSSCRSPRAALKCSYRSDRLTRH